MTAVLGFVLFSSAVGDGALPTASLPAFGVTGGDGSLSTVAQLGDTTATATATTPSACPRPISAAPTPASSTSSSATAGALPSTPTALNLANASFRITGHASEMLGYSIAGNDVNDDGLADIAIGAPMAELALPGRQRRRVRRLRAGQPGRPQHHGALLPRLHERADQPGASVAARQPLRGLRRQRAPGHVAGGAARRQRRRLQRSRRRRPRRPAPRRRRRRGRALRQAAGRAHRPQRPLGVRLPVLLPHGFPGPRGPLRRAQRRERRAT